jgi:UDP-2,3-diacylglucosamine pyrophosphatase LpxH
MGGDRLEISPGVKVDFRIFTNSDHLIDFINNLPDLKVPRDKVELVLNGDFLDFLAEGDPEPDHWTAYKTPEQKAAQIFERIKDREKGVFDAMARLIADGAKITVMVGNHDLELCWPAVQEAFARALGTVPGERFKVMDNADSYQIDTAVIEHGNKYDIWNNTDPKPTGHGSYEPCAGSELVVQVMNPMKVDYPFIDLLKPEDQAAVPVLLALNPKAFYEIPETLALYLKARFHRLGIWEAKEAVRTTRGMKDSPAIKEDMKREAVKAMVENLVETEFRATRGPGDTQQERAIKFMERMAQSDKLSSSAKRSLNLKAQPEALRSMAGWNPIDNLKSWLVGLFDDVSDTMRSRYPFLLLALRSLRNNRDFDISVETDKDYIDAARLRVSNGAKYSIMGHSHLAKNEALGNDARYFNTGAWANIMRIPDTIVKGTLEDAFDALSAFMDDMKSDDIKKWIEFHPNHVRLDLNDSGKIIQAELK